MKTDTDPKKILLYSLGFIGLFLLMALVVWIGSNPARMEAVGEPRAEERRRHLEQLNQAAREVLETPGWVDETFGIVRLPIRDAMRVMVQEWQDPVQGRERLLSRLEQATPPPFEFE